MFYKKLQVLKAIIVMGLISSCMNTEMQLKLIDTKSLPHYSSASSIELYNNQLYIMGDDARYLLILDTEYNTVDSLHLFEGTEKRIEKADKADPEASTIIEFEGKPHLFLCGSASTNKRENVFLISLDKTHKVDSFSIASFIQKIKQQLPDINIEGCAAFNNEIVLANRANLTTKQNQLIVTSNSFFINNDKSFKIINIITDTNDVRGISSLSYLKEKDLLLLTASVEETASSYTDGAIGNSYIGIIKNFSSAIKNNSVQVDEWIDLAAAIPSLQKQKIEGLTIGGLTKNIITVHIVSDNDNGESSIYKLSFSL